MNARENWLRAVEFRYPEWIPCRVQCYPAIWKQYGDDLAKVYLDHPRTMPGFRPGVIKDYSQMPTGYRKGEYLTDNWGCLRVTLQDGIAGEVIQHPLADWSALATYQPPDPLTGTLDPINQGINAYMQGRSEPMGWDEVAVYVRAQKERGELVAGDGQKLFDRLYFLRGFENLMLDLVTDPPELPRLFAMLEEYEQKLIGRWRSLGVDYISFHTDFATQQGLMISPATFRKWLKPLFTNLFRPCREAGIHVYVSGDGRVLDVVDDMVESGFSVHDPQIRPNTAEGIAHAYGGKLCAEVDLDQQGFAFMTPQEIRDQVKMVVDVVGRPEGGLMLRGVVMDTGVPLRNIEAIADAMEDYCFP